MHGAKKHKIVSNIACSNTWLPFAIFM